MPPRSRKECNLLVDVILDMNVSVTWFLVVPAAVLARLVTPLEPVLCTTVLGVFACRLSTILKVIVTFSCKMRKPLNLCTN